MTDFSTESYFCLQQVQLKDIVCELCHKKCKSKSGLKRHKTVKHRDTREDVEKQKEGGQESYLTFVAYSRIVEKAKHKIADNKIYPKTIRDELRCPHPQQQSTRHTS